MTFVDHHHLLVAAKKKNLINQRKINMQSHQPQHQLSTNRTKRKMLGNHKKLTQLVVQVLRIGVEVKQVIAQRG